MGKKEMDSMLWLTKLEPDFAFPREIRVNVHDPVGSEDKQIGALALLWIIWFIYCLPITLAYVLLTYMELEQSSFFIKRMHVSHLHPVIKVLLIL